MPTWRFNRRDLTVTLVCLLVLIGGKYSIESIYRQYVYSITGRVAIVDARQITDNAHCRYEIQSLRQRVSDLEKNIRKIQQQEQSNER